MMNEILKLHKEWLESDGSKGQRANLQRANLQEADLRGTYLRGTYLRGANLQEANLRGANLQEADLGGANLQGVYLKRANLERADLHGANLQEADLHGADLQGAYLYRANLQEAYLQGAIIGQDHILSSSNFRYFELSDYYCYIFESERGLVMKIGCEVHLVEDWKNFTDKEILKMDGQRALSFWHKDKETLMRKCYDE